MISSMRHSLILLLFVLSQLTATGASETFRLLQWNIWQEGTSVKGGYEAIVNEIARLRPDFVTFSEVRNYHQSNFTAKLVNDLRKRRETYYSFYSYDSGLLSRYPLHDSLTVFPCEGDHGSVYRLRCEAKGVKFAVYTAHLDYQDDTYYEVRGYDGNNWREIPILRDSAEVLRRNNLSQRDEGIQAFLRTAQQDADAGYVVVLGGDFNEPSHLDWTKATRYLYDHHGLVIPWPVTSMLSEAGFTDIYRARWNNPLTHPGFTYPSANPAVSVNRLSWAPLADERERIDYLFCKGKDVEVTHACLFGPEESIAYFRPRPNPTKECFIKPLDVWPSDHKGVWGEIRVTR